MDDNRVKTIKSEPMDVKSEPATHMRSEPTGDWRVQIKQDARRRIINFMVGTLKNLPAYSKCDNRQLIEICENFEEKIFRSAKTTDNYTSTIHKRLKEIANSSHHTVAASASNPVTTQNIMVAGAGQGFSSQNVNQVSRDCTGGSARQEIQPKICANTLMEIPRSQSSQKVVNQQQMHTVSQSSQLQCSRQPTLPTKESQKPRLVEPNSSFFQQNQPFSQENKVGQKQLSQHWKNMPASLQQPVGLQSKISGLQQQRSMIGAQSNVLNLQSCPANTLQQVGVTSSQQKVQPTVQPVQMHKILESQRQSKQQAMEQRLTSDALLQPQNVIDQQKLLPSQSILAEVSSATSPSELASIVEWHDEAYQKLQSMKKEFSPRLIHIREQFKVVFQKTPELYEKFKEKSVAVQRYISFLSMPRSGLARYSKAQFDHHCAVIRALESSRQNNSVSVQQHSQLLQPLGRQSQISLLQQHSNMNSALTSTPVASSPLPSTQHGLQSSVHSGSLTGLEQRNTQSSLQHAARPESQNTAGAQQGNLSHNANVNAFDSTINSSKQSSTISPSQRQNQQLKHQKGQSQNLKQQLHPQFQQKMQKVPIPNIRPVATSAMLQQHSITSQPSKYPCLMKLPKTHQIQATTIPSPQMSQYSSCQIDQQNFLSPLPGTGTSSDSSTSLARSPFSVLAECASPLSIPENIEHPQNTVALTQVDTQDKGLNQLLAIASPGISTSPSCTELTSQGGNQESSAIQRLIKAVESISSKALSAAVNEIGMVMRMEDMTAGAGCNDSLSVVGENLAYETNYRLQYGCSSAKKMMRNISSTALTSLADSDRPKQSIGQKRDFDSTATSTTKRRRIEPSNGLLDEIRFINLRLLETAITLDSTEDTAALHAGEETIVRCAYGAVAVNDNLKMQHASLMMPVSLLLLVPANYPNASPIILDELSVDRSCESKESVDLWQKTRSRFSTLLHKFSEPVSLAEMASTWDISAREVFLEYAKQAGGEIFSSRYGTWEDCVT